MLLHIKNIEVLWEGNDPIFIFFFFFQVNFFKSIVVPLVPIFFDSLSVIEKKKKKS